MAVRSPVINVMAAAALKAARGLIRDFGEVEQLQVSIKGPGDFVSAADLKAERTLKSDLDRARTRWRDRRRGGLRADPRRTLLGRERCRRLSQRPAATRLGAPPTE